VPKRLGDPLRRDQLPLGMSRMCRPAMPPRWAGRGDVIFDSWVHPRMMGLEDI